MSLGKLPTQSAIDAYVNRIQRQSGVVRELAKEDLRTSKDKPKRLAAYSEAVALIFLLSEVKGPCLIQWEGMHASRLAMRATVESFYRLFGTDLRLAKSITKMLMVRLRDSKSVVAFTRTTLTTLLESDLDLNPPAESIMVAQHWIDFALPAFPSAVKVLNDVKGGQLTLDSEARMHATDVLSSLMRASVKQKLDLSRHASTRIRESDSVFFRGEGTMRKAGSHRDNCGHQ